MKHLMIATVLATLAIPAHATRICDYRPSELISSAGAATTAALGTTVGTVGAAGSAMGFCTLTHAVTGMTMLGSTAGGASAAGTVGIMGGTAGTVGATAAVVLNPLVWIPALVVGVGTVAVEGACAVAAYMPPPV